GGRRTTTRTRQAWEPAYFFADGQGTADASNWPPSLEDELTGDDLARFERAKEAKDASGILDLVSGGETWSLLRMSRYFGVHPDKPVARYRAPSNWKVRLITGSLVVFVVGMILLATLDHR